MRKMWDHTIDLKKEFMPKKRKFIPCPPEKREKK